MAQNGAMSFLASEAKCSPSMCFKMVIVLVVIPLIFLSAALLQGEVLWNDSGTPFDPWSLVLGTDHGDPADFLSASDPASVRLSSTARGTACLSRVQHMLHRPRSQSVPFNPALVSAFAKYEELHADCSRSVGGNWTELFFRAVQGNSTDGDTPDCKALVYMEEGTGLGNRLMSLVTAFLYAFMTNRILLVDNTSSAGHLGALLCEPFFRSSWRLPDDERFPYKMLTEEAPGLGAAIDVDFKDTKVVKLVLDHIQNGGESNFFCAETREKMQSVDWLIWNSNQYFLPRLFTFPEFWPELPALFPDASLTFTHLARLLLLPNNAIWERVFRVHSSYLSSAEKLVGIQIRRHWVENAGDYSPLAFQRIVDCLVDHDILPAVENFTESTRLPGEKLLNMMDLRAEPRSPPAKEVLRNGGSVTAVIIASLQRQYVDELQDLYTHSATTDGRLVRVHMVTHEGYEQFAYDQAEKAFVEMWLLSLSDDVATSAYSTFGYVAQGLGAMRPYIVNLLGNLEETNSSSMCFVGQSPDPCNHFPFWPKGDCGNASALTSAHEEWVERHLVECQDVPGGIQLVSSSTI